MDQFSISSLWTEVGSLWTKLNFTLKASEIRNREFISIGKVTWLSVGSYCYGGATVFIISVLQAVRFLRSQNPTNLAVYRQVDYLLYRLRAETNSRKVIIRCFATVTLSANCLQIRYSICL